MDIKSFKALKYEDTIEFIKKKINDDYYVCIYLYGENIAGHKQKFNHDCMI